MRASVGAEARSLSRSLETEVSRGFVCLEPAAEATGPSRTGVLFQPELVVDAPSALSSPK
jgi:hypothetical protein